jgi:3-phenylpropionate/trans-cinnamate dioxygenase ferredoxin reductase subunit
MTPPASADVLVVGAGQAAFTLATCLRAEGFTGSIRIVGDEPHLPYQRPPLSKAYLGADGPPGRLSFQDLQRYTDRDVTVDLGRRVTAIDRDERSVGTSDGVRYSYGHLVLATGARNRRLAEVCPGGERAIDLRTLDDAARLRERLYASERVVVIGAGFLGLEFAAAAAKSAGADVTVLEAGPALMGRVVSTPVAAAFSRRHHAAGVRFRLGTSVAGVETGPGGTYLVLTERDERLPADLVVSSVGVVPNVELAVAAGLEVRNGVVVDDVFATDDPAVSAVGDCASFALPLTGEHVRLESVQNAVDGARCLARRLVGSPEPYRAVPWFWSDQAGLKLQIAGVARPADAVVVRGDEASDAFSVFRFRGDQLVAVESVSSPADHMAARRLLAGPSVLTPDQAADPSIELKNFLPARAS